MHVLCLLQLQQCQDRMLELEKRLENPYDESRVRYLEGKDPAPAEMHEKIEDVCHKKLLLFFINICPVLNKFICSLFKLGCLLFNKRRRKNINS